MPNPTLTQSAFDRLDPDGRTTTSRFGGGYSGSAVGAPPPPVQPGASAYGQDPYGQSSYGQDAPSIAGTDRFTVEGAIYKTGLLLVILAITAAATGALLPESLYMPALIGGALIGLGLVLGISFKPNLAPTLSPVYAVAEGVVIGAISALYSSIEGFEGLPAQAALGTITVLGVMLALYRTGVIKVTQRFRMVVTVATGAIFVTYLLSFVLGFFGVNFGVLNGSGPLSILLSVVIIGVAAFNLALDFDFIETAAARGVPAKMEWYAAFGLLVTLVWLYLEILRLLAKLQSRD